MAESLTTIIVQLFNTWEIQVLILLSFALQLFLFFCGGFRSRNNNGILSFLLWLAYLSADYVAVYALGYLSRHSPTTATNESDKSSQQIQQFSFLWAPFLLIHLGGQDTITAFSIEDNELWLRHMLNLLVQVCLVLILLWKSMAYDQLLVPSIFLFVTGIIKYGERIWALKWGSQKSLRSSQTNQIPKELLTAQEAEILALQEGDLLPVQEGGRELTYPTILKYAVGSEQGVRHVFSGRKINQMGDDITKGFRLQDPRQADAQVLFKRLEVELSIMYGDLFTKARIIQTTTAAILRCISITSTTVAFVLFITMSVKQPYIFTKFDTVIAYILFIGALCLEVCAIFIVMMSPRTWAILEFHAQGGCRSLLARVTWFMLDRIHPQAQPWWSNSMGQYNLLKSCMDDNNSNVMCTMIAKVMGLVGANDLWNNMRHVKRDELTRETKEHIYQTIIAASLGQPLGTGESKGFLFRCPFEVALLTLHIWTDVLLHKAKKGTSSSTNISRETRSLMDTCKVISDYMMYLLVSQPAMLPISGNVQDLPAVASAKVKKAIATSSKEQFLEERGSMGIDLFENYGIPHWMDLFTVANIMLPEEGVVDADAAPGAHTVFETLTHAWVRLLAYAACKSSPYNHARRLSKGGELITFVWLFMVHQGLGDQGPHEVDLVPRMSDEGQSLEIGSSFIGGKFLLFSI